MIISKIITVFAVKKSVTASNLFGSEENAKTGSLVIVIRMKS